MDSCGLCFLTLLVIAAGTLLRIKQLSCSWCIVLRMRARVVLTVYCDQTGVTIHGFFRHISGNSTIVAQFTSSIERQLSVYVLA